MQNNRGIACCSAGRMKAHTIAQRNTSHSEGIGLAQVLFGGKRQLADVVQRLDVVGSDAGFLELLLIKFVRQTGFREL